ncbi:MAG: DUF4097 domain-containing protein [Pyrinomonadaceae bacterium]
MKNSLPLIFFLIVIAAAPFAANAGIRGTTGQSTKTIAAQGVERSVAADASVAVSLCTGSGNITVRGWDRREVRARSRNAAAVELRRGDAASLNAMRLEVLLTDPANRRRTPNDCQSFSDVELDVPRGASVEVKTLSGDVKIEEIAEARVQTVSGNALVRRIGKGIEVVSVSGDVDLENASGSVRLRSVSGSVDVRDANPSAASDELEVTTTSGNVKLERIGHARVEVAAVSGNVSMAGGLARGGRYRFRTISGNVDVLLPENASFQFTARVSRGGSIIFTNLPFKFETDNSQASSRLVNGVFGTGDATLNLTSFSGTLRLRRK